MEKGQELYTVLRLNSGRRDWLHAEASRPEAETPSRAAFPASLSPRSQEEGFLGNHSAPPPPRETLAGGLRAMLADGGANVHFKPFHLV